MKPFGHSKKDAITCEYGCCYTFYNRKSPCRRKADRRRRKTARQATNRFILQELMDEQIAVNMEKALEECYYVENDWLENERDNWFYYINGEHDDYYNLSGYDYEDDFYLSDQRGDYEHYPYEDYDDPWFDDLYD